MVKVAKAVFENKCSQPVYLYGTQDGNHTVLEIAAGATEEFTEARGFLPWREQRITLSFGNFFGGVLRPTNLDAAVIELNADYESFLVPRSHISFLGQLGYSDLNLEIAFWKDRINGTLAVDGGSNPACFARAKTAFKVSDCEKADGSGKVLQRTWGQLCMPVCPETGVASEVPCWNSCYVEPGVPVEYAEYVSHHSFAWKNGRWVPSPATVDKHFRENGQQWSATFECWDSQTGPIGFPICDGVDPREMPSELAVWQVIACPDGQELAWDSTQQAEATEGCKDLSKTCQEDLDWAMRQGIHESPEWYPGLTQASTQEQFQSFLHKRLGSCPEPCGDAAMSSSGVGKVTTTTSTTISLVHGCKELSSDCQGDLDWAMQVGIRQHPEWYPGLLPSSSREEFQSFLHISLGSCPAPCEEDFSSVAFRPSGDISKDRACRGRDALDNSNSYFTVMFTDSLGACKRSCVAAAVCKGIEYAAATGRCEVWTRSEGIGAVRELPGHECWIYDSQ